MLMDSGQGQRLTDGSGTSRARRKPHRRAGGGRHRIGPPRGPAGDLRYDGDQATGSLDLEHVAVGLVGLVPFQAGKSLLAVLVVLVQHLHLLLPPDRRVEVAGFGIGCGEGSDGVCLLPVAQLAGRVASSTARLPSQYLASGQVAQSQAKLLLAAISSESR